MRPISLTRLGLSALALSLCCSCAQLDRALHAGKRRTEQIKGAMTGGRAGYWDDEKARGPARIVVDLGEQRAFFYKGRKLIGRSTISTGRKGYETPPGRYFVIQKDADHTSSLYGDYVSETGTIVQANVDVRKQPRPAGAEFRGAPMPYFLRFTGAYGMHAGYVPRYQASHGCIRMPRAMARRFYHAAKLGTPVLVRE